MYKILLSILLFITTISSYSQKYKILYSKERYNSGYLYWRQDVIDKANKILSEYDLELVEVPRNTEYRHIRIFFSENKTLKGNCVGYQINDDILVANSEQILSVFLHELGHDFGWEHVNGDFVMNKASTSIKMTYKHRQWLTDDAKYYVNKFKYKASYNWFNSVSTINNIEIDYQEIENSTKSKYLRDNDLEENYFEENDIDFEEQDL